MRKIAIIGCGYVGLVTGTCFADLGNHVVCIDVEEPKIAALRLGQVPFYEPGLGEMVRRNLEKQRLSFTTDVTTGLQDQDMVFIAVGTPTGPNGNADLQYVREAARQIAEALDGPKLIINKSTVPVETGDLVATIIREHKREDHEVHVVSNPEFLREGSAISDFMNPDRIVIGAQDDAAIGELVSLYAPLGAPIIATDIRTAEMIKYSANAFLAMKISFINEIANICDRAGADVVRVVEGIGSDKRIGSAFLGAGIGFGGSCFPKDVRALSHAAEQYGVQPAMLTSILDVNRRQIEVSIAKLSAALGTLKRKHLALLGLAFKANTDDVRESPAIALALACLAAGASVIAHDPVAITKAKDILGDRVSYVTDPKAAAQGADAVLVATDWSEYKQMDLAEIRGVMKGNVLFDGRNIYASGDVDAAGLRHVPIGRGPRNDASPVRSGSLGFDVNDGQGAQLNVKEVVPSRSR